MNKSELIETMAEELNLLAKDASSIVDTIIQAMTESLAKGDNIEIRGFGSFHVREYKPYTGWNPKTGEQVMVKEKKLPFFKVGKEMKARVNG